MSAAPRQRAGILPSPSRPTGPELSSTSPGRDNKRGGRFPGWIARARRSRCTRRPAVTARRASRPTASGWRFPIGSGQGDDIWVKDLDRDTPSRLSFLAGLNRWPVWTPDGKNIVFQSTNPAAPGLYWIRSDGSGEAQRLTDGKLNEVPYSFSPDGKRLAFFQTGNGGSMDIFTAPVEGDPGHPRLGKAELFLGTPFNEVLPGVFARRAVAGVCSRTSRGPCEVYVRPFPGPGGRWQISTGGGSFPLWSRDGRELLFETPDRRVMAVSYTAKGDSFAAGKPRVWAETRLLDAWCLFQLRSGAGRQAPRGDAGGRCGAARSRPRT